jgi:hypothetical protein
MHDARIVIRPFGDANQQAVRDLFVRINRELAPPEMREAFEAYIARAGRRDRPDPRLLCRAQGRLLGRRGSRERTRRHVRA